MRSHSSLFSYCSLCWLSSLVAGRSRRLGRRFLLPILSILVLSCPSLAGAASAGATTWTTNGPEGGRIQPLAIDPANPATFPAPLLGAPRFSEWSPPVNLGSPVNKLGFNTAGPALSKDGLSLYFQSNRTGGFGVNDIWVSQRASREDAWGEPVNLGPTINTAANEDVPSFSRDGHTMYFNSDRAGFGLRDIWISRRTNTRDDFGWEEPVNAGLVNSAFMDAGPSYLENGEAGTPLLYFGSTRLGGLYDIYVSAQAADGSWGPADLVPELSSPQSDQRPSVRFDGLELFLHSDRPGSVLTDLWVSTRETTVDPWSAPVNLGATVNSPSLDQQPFIASDRETLFFASDRPGGVGGPGKLDIYMTTREKNPHEVPESVVDASLVPVAGVGKHELMRSIASKKDAYKPFGLPCGGADIEGIACGATKSRDLATTDCRNSGYYFDFYSFSGTAGQQVTIRLTSSGFVPGIGLYDPFEQLTAGAYNAQGGTSTLLVFTLNVSGTWRIGVSGDTDETGAYTLTLECSAAASCVPDPTALCLNNGRFRVAATFLAPDGRSGDGQIVPETSDTGLFWFFSASNIEAIVKVVNGCAFNDRYWVFAAGLTNVQVVLTVTDTSTGETRTYTNPQGAPFAPIQDTNAFAACP
jgi:hypothetical protein